MRLARVLDLKLLPLRQLGHHVSSIASSGRARGESANESTRTPYLKSSVIDLGLPDFINHLVPLVEVQFTTPVADNFGNSFVTTGTIQPGVIWVGNYFQVGVEAVVPVNGQSGRKHGRLGGAAPSLSRRHVPDHRRAAADWQGYARATAVWRLRPCAAVF
jgi:hypothetical protein